LQVSWRDIGWPVGNFRKHPSQVIEQTGDLRIALALCAQAVEMVPIQEIACLLLLRRKIDRSSVIRIHYLEQQHLRAFQVSTDSYQDYPLGIAYVLPDYFVTRPNAPGDKRSREQQSHRTRQGPFWRSGKPSADAPASFGKAITKIQPDLFFEDRRGLGDLDGFDALEQYFHTLELATAFGTRRQVKADLVFAFGIAVVMQDNLFFTQVIHRATLANGSSC